MSPCYPKTRLPFDPELERYKTMYDTMPLLNLSYCERRPKSVRSLASSGKKTLIKDFIADQFERFRYKVSQNQVDSKDLLLEMFAKMALKADYEEEAPPKAASRINGSSSYFLKAREPRAVMLLSLPPEANLPAVLSHVRGGQLERVILGSRPEPFVEFHFLDKKAADAFFKYARSGVFVINGVKPKVRRLPFDVISPGPVQSNIMQAVSKHRATRVIKMRRPGELPVVSEKEKASYPVASEYYVKDLDIEEIRKDMAQFGEIIEIKALIANLCTLSIHYSALSELILAMRSFQLVGSAHQKKYQGWKVEYGKDPADVPCYNV